MNNNQRILSQSENLLWSSSHGPDLTTWPAWVCLLGVSMICSSIILVLWGWSGPLLDWDWPISEHKSCIFQQKDKGYCQETVNQTQKNTERNKVNVSEYLFRPACLANAVFYSVVNHSLWHLKLWNELRNTNNRMVQLFSKILTFYHDLLVWHLNQLRSLLAWISDGAPRCMFRV
jgi:hypothetical protein